MRRGMLSNLFVGAVTKRLTLVETITPKSNQHEIQGVRALRDLMGDEDRKGVDTRFVWLSDEAASVSEDGFASWSNVRKGKPRAAEYHLYYPGNAVTERMEVGDLLVIALRQDGTLLFVVAPAGGTGQNQLLWLFGLDAPDGQFSFQRVEGEHDPELGFAARYILDELSIELEEPGSDELDTLVDRFGLTFPTTRIFSALARESLPGISAVDDPDLALIEWLDREEQLFRRLERRVVAERIGGGFILEGSVDVDGFLDFSLSVQNRRKSRAGHALENHVEALFKAIGIHHVRGAETENRNKPDFLFPDAASYRDAGFPIERLTMLGAKSTLKDRWRQVLSEAQRIPHKHLLTLEPGISENQTDEMRAKGLSLVVPTRLHDTFRAGQRDWLLSVGEFIDVVRSRQGA